MEPLSDAAAQPLLGSGLIASLALLLITLLVLYLKPKSNLSSPKTVTTLRRLSTAADEEGLKPSVRILYGTQTGAQHDAACSPSAERPGLLLPVSGSSPCWTPPNHDLPSAP